MAKKHPNLIQGILTDRDCGARKFAFNEDVKHYSFDELESVDTSSGTWAYVPDSGSTWIPVTKRIRVAPGTPLRLGRYFEIMLP